MRVLSRFYLDLLRNVGLAPPATRYFGTSPACLMPRNGGGSGVFPGDKSIISCPKCKSRILVYCKFSGTRRHIKCHKCNNMLLVGHTNDSDNFHDKESELFDILGKYEASMKGSEGNGTRLGRLYAPSYEEENIDDTSTPLLSKPPPPREIFAYLDRYIQGQERAKKVLSVSIYNHYKRLHAASKRDPSPDQPKLDKSNVLVIGPTGCGKTYMFQMVSKMLNVPLVVCDCTSLTQAGYVGEDVETVVVRLWQAAGQNIQRTQQGIIVLDELDKLASKRNKNGGRDIGGEGVQQSLLKIIEGTNVTVLDKSKNKAYQIDTTNILFLASGAFVGLEKLIQKRTSATSLGFGSPMSRQHQISEENKEEIERIEEISEATRRERIKKIKVTEEQNRLKDEYLRQVQPKDILDYGVITELAGRIPVITTLDSLTQEDLVQIAMSKERGVIAQIEQLLSLNSCQLEFTNDAIKAIAELAFCKKTGARALKSIIETSLLEAMFEIPGSDINKVTITSETVLDRKEPIYSYKCSNADKRG